MRLPIALVAVISLTHAAEKPPEKTPDKVPEPAVTQAKPTTLECPESVVEGPDGTLYCSNLGGKEVTLEDAVYKDKNGFIATIKPDGSIAEVKFVPLDGEPPLHAPKGMVILGSTLWVADVDRVVAFDLKTRKQTSEIDLRPSQVRFANDLVAAGPEGPLLCSDTSYDQVLVIDPKIKSVKVLGKWQFGGNEKKKLGAANGLWITGASPKRTLYVAEFPLAAAVPDGEAPSGAVMTFDLDDQFALSNPQKLSLEAGLWDGVAVAEDGTVYASDWATNALFILPKDGAPRQLADELQGPADFCVLKDGSAILVPEMSGNKVTRVDIK